MIESFIKTYIEPVSGKGAARSMLTAIINLYRSTNSSGQETTTIYNRLVFMCMGIDIDAEKKGLNSSERHANMMFNFVDLTNNIINKDPSIDREIGDLIFKGIFGE